VLNIIGKIVGLSSSPPDLVTGELCSGSRPRGTSCDDIDAQLTLYLSNAYDPSLDIMSITKLIRSNINNGSWLSAHSAIVSISFLDNTDITTK